MATAEVHARTKIATILRNAGCVPEGFDSGRVTARERFLGGIRAKATRATVTCRAQRLENPASQRGTIQTYNEFENVEEAQLLFAQN